MSVKLIGLIISVVLFIFLVFRKFNKKWIKGLLLFASFLLILFMTFRYLFPLTPAPKPSGNEKVLTDTIFYSHESMFPEMLTSEKERELPVNVWCPEDAKEKKHPLLLFSHGSFGIGESNETLFLELASRGYIVMSLNHPYHSFRASLSDGRSVMVDFNFIKSVMASQGSADLKGTLESLKSWSKIRLEDIRFILDKLLDAETDNDYEQYIDTNRIVLSGHSLGGSAALAVGRERNQQIRALVILESPFIQDIVGIEGNEYVFTKEEYPLPVLHVYSDSLFSKLGKITTYAMNERLIKSKDPKFVNKHLDGVGHIGLTDMALASPIITNWIDGGLNKRQSPETLLELNNYVLDFLNQYNQ